MKTLMVAVMAMAACAMAGCTTPATVPPPDPPMIAPPQPGAAGATNVGPGSKAGFCTFKGADGKLYEAKC